jgi:monofunctional biosynthetic peptidoglycan transglycosylase
MRLLLPSLLVLLGGLFLPAAASSSSTTEPPVRTLMQFDGSASEPRWVAVNDGVMGGRSVGGPALADGQLQFRGELSLANNGGFSSIRTVGQRFDLGGATAMVLRVRGDGRPYQLRLSGAERFRGMAVSYGGEFATQAGQWIVVRVPLATLEPTVRGVKLQGPPIELSDVREIGLLIADKREAAFALDVDWIGLE